MKIIKDVQQGSEDWFALRTGKMTASHAQEIGNNGKGLETYIYNILAEKYSMAGTPPISNLDMERGIALEEDARTLYELERSVTVDTVGFILHNDFVGCSPDGLVGEDGGIEIKCHNDQIHFRLLVNGESAIDKKYLWQIQMNLLITGREWWDYIAYNPNFQQSLIIHRIIPDPKMHESLLKGFEIGTEKIQHITNFLEYDESEATGTNRDEPTK